MQQKIIPNLWFDGNAKQATDYYVSVFPDGEILRTTHYPNSAKEGLADFQANLAGEVLTVEFKILGMHFVAINAGLEFTFNESVSFAVLCKDQAEIDFFWEKLSKVPAAEQCGWCKDQFGLSWQIIPENWEKYMSRPGAYETMMRQHKIVISDY